jgi:uncharacterized repeat protein (TIGR01451 family)
MMIGSYGIFAAAILASAGFLMSHATVAVAQSSPIKVSIETKDGKHLFNPGEQITLLITVKNTSKVTAELSSSCDTLDNEVSLTDESDNSPPMTALGKKITSVFSMSCPRRALRLPPGASQQINLDISQMYELSRSGKYTISISRFVRNPRGIAKSNSLTIVIR